MITEKLSGIPFVKTHRGGGIFIPENSDLNTLAYCNPGRYRAGSRAAAQSFLNCPASNVFIMEVDYITPDEGTWIYVCRKIIEAASAMPIYYQYVSINKSTNAVTYYQWKQVNLTSVTID